MVVKPLHHAKLVKKHRKKFRRHQAHLYKRLGDKWRKPRGIDNRMRRRFKGMAKMPKIGYGTNRKTKYICPDGFKHIKIDNIRELEVLLMQHRKLAAIIGHTVSSKNRAKIVERAKQLNIKVVNANAKLRSMENE